MAQWLPLQTLHLSDGLPSALLQNVPGGRARYSFVHEGVVVDDPTLDTVGHYRGNPREYGFSIRGFVGGKTAWARDFANGSMLVTQGDMASHVLSATEPARILFVDPQGRVLQDVWGSAPALLEQTSVRITLLVKVGLQGQSPEHARAWVQRAVGRALQADSSPRDEIRALGYEVESCSLVASVQEEATTTNFSQLLDI